jgi:hypothetical protein
VCVVYESGSQTSLSALAGLLKRVPKARPRKFASPRAAGNVLETPAIQWLRERTIPQGHRNRAVYAMTQALLWSGYDFAAAEEEILTWIRGHTEPTYPAAEAQAVVRSCARRFARGEPLGLDHRELMGIVDINGEVMPEEVARTVYQALPHPAPVPLERRKHRPLLESLTRAVEAMADGRLRGRLRDEEAAQILGISVHTLRCQLKQVLKEARLLHTKRGRYGRSMYLINPEGRKPYGTTYHPPLLIFRELETQFQTEQSSSRNSEANSHTRLLWRRWPQLMVRLLVALKRLSGLLNAVSPKSTSSAPFSWFMEPVSGEARAPGGLSPPRGPPLGEFPPKVATEPA